MLAGLTLTPPPQPLMSSPAIPYPRLSSHLNVWNSCLHLLQRAGYALSTEEVSADGDVLWLARRNGYTLMADNPIELLGLANVQQALAPADSTNARPYWWSVSGEDLYRALLASAQPFRPPGDDE